VIVVDASVWVSRFTPPDVHHVASREWLEQQAERGRPVIAPGILLAEVAGAIARRSGRTRLGHRAVASLLRWSPLRLMPIDTLLAEAAASLAADLALRGMDATYIAAAHRLDIPLVTWDREQLERSRSVIKAYEPGPETL
jgi:predicted nucleic acid-binding protein